MSELLKGFKFPPPRERKFFAEIQGKKVEVSHEKKLEIIKNGEQNYVLDDGKPKLVVKRLDRYKFPEIKDFKSNPVWPKEDFEWKL